LNLKISEALFKSVKQKVIEGNSSKIDIICAEHGIFSQVAKSHLSGQGCPSCGAQARQSHTMSKGETKILNFLKENNIDFVPQKTFEDCKYKSLLSFDFYLPHQNILIEFDGQQHHVFVKQFHTNIMGFKIQQKRDEIKTQYAEDNNISLIRIRWDEENMIRDILYRLI